MHCSNDYWGMSVCGPILYGFSVGSLTNVVDREFSFAFILSAIALPQDFKLSNHLEQSFGMHACIFWLAFFDKVSIFIFTNAIHMESVDINKTNVPRINQKKKQETKNVWANEVTAIRWGINMQTAGNMRLIKTRGQRIGRRKKIRM